MMRRVTVQRCTGRRGDGKAESSARMSLLQPRLLARVGASAGACADVQIGGGRLTLYCFASPSSFELCSASAVGLCRRSWPHAPFRPR